MILTPPDSIQIARASITARGLTPPKGRVRQALTTQGAASDAVRSLEVTFTNGPGKTASADLWLPVLSAIKRIYLNSVTYADGSSRRFSGDEACQAAPDPLMLIAGR